MCPGDELGWAIFHLRTSESGRWRRERTQTRLQTSAQRGGLPGFHAAGTPCAPARVPRGWQRDTGREPQPRGCQGCRARVPRCVKQRKPLAGVTHLGLSVPAPEQGAGALIPGALGAHSRGRGSAHPRAAPAARGAHGLCLLRSQLGENETAAGKCLPPARGKKNTTVLLVNVVQTVRFED